VQERAGHTLELVGIGNAFLNRSQKAQQLRGIINEWYYINLKASAKQKKLLPD
jgi:hypothetical protein